MFISRSPGTDLADILGGLTVLESRSMGRVSEQYGTVTRNLRAIGHARPRIVVFTDQGLHLVATAYQTALRILRESGRMVYLGQQAVPLSLNRRTYSLRDVMIAFRLFREAEALLDLMDSETVVQRSVRSA